MNGKQHSRQITDYTNQRSCSLECVIHWQHFKQWWILFLMTWYLTLWLSSIWTICLSSKKIYHHWSQYKIGPTTIMGQWFIFETVEMWIPQNEDWIPWNDHWRRKNIYGHFEVKRNPRLAYSFYCQTSQRIFRIWKILSTIYPKLSDITQPLNELLKKDRKFDWNPECQSSFNEMKKWFTEEPVLAMPDHSRPFQIEMDASKYATGAVLSQLDSNGDRHPVAFYSKTFSPAEQNFNIHDRELLAIIWALECYDFDRFSLYRLDQ